MGCRKINLVLEVWHFEILKMAVLRLHFRFVEEYLAFNHNIFNLLNIVKPTS
jgi:hypothetical protein